MRVKDIVESAGRGADNARTIVSIITSVFSRTNGDSVEVRAGYRRGLRLFFREVILRRPRRD